MKRVTEDEGKCPEGTTPCIADQAIKENIICYQRMTSSDYDETCPITDLLIVDASQVASYTAQGYSKVTIVENTSYVVFSKQVDKMPPTTIRVGFAPCMNQFEQSHGPEMNPSVYPPEIVKPGCTLDKQKLLVTDPRYTQIKEFKTNEYVT